MGEVENQEEISADAEHQCNTQSQDAPTIFEEFTCRICLFTDQHNAQIFGSETCNMDLVDKMSRHLSIQVISTHLCLKNLLSLTFLEI